MHPFLACCLVLFAPLWGAILAGLHALKSASAGRPASRAWVYMLTLSAMLVSTIAAGFLAAHVWSVGPLEQVLYTWAALPDMPLTVGFSVDRLSALMIVVVCGVSLLVHLYSVGYMHDDPGFARFFSYISLFTFAMLALVMADNFLQLFFGWEGVGLVSYLLIGFWYEKESALKGSLKAFVVNRVADAAFVLGMGLILAHLGSLQFSDLKQAAPYLSAQYVHWGRHAWPVVEVSAILLFIGAMGKSAQIPLHVWLPESMEGPTPISALIHAATMVTAGIYMVARLSPLYAHAPFAQNLILMVGSTGALFLGLLGVVQNDIKRVVAYSTLSQLGYMAAALGAGAYGIAIFHLATHAAFKALLFLGAGSVILAMHHEQDLRRMGALWRVMPVTYATFLLGSLALMGVPPFSGFFSKDAILEAVAHSSLPSARYAHMMLLAGVFVTAFYSMRLFIRVFHGSAKDAHAFSHAHESPWTVTLPLILLAVPSVMLGHLLAPSIFSGDFFASALTPSNVPFESPGVMLQSALHHAPLWLVLAASILAVGVYGLYPTGPEKAVLVLPWVYRLLFHHYFFDAFYAWLVRRLQICSQILAFSIDRGLVDRCLVMLPPQKLVQAARGLRLMHSGKLFDYVAAFVVGLVVLCAFVYRCFI